MDKNNGFKVMVIAALVIGVLALSVGFAAFARDLTITNSAATYRATDKDLKVNFSITDAETNGGSVAGVMSGTGVVDTNAGTATINGATDTGFANITGITAPFTKKGQKATYSFYLNNDSDYTAYLKSATFASPEKTCTAIDGTDATLVTSACKDISLTLTIDGTKVLATDTTGFNAITLAAGDKKAVTVEIEYNGSNVLPDGDFNVTFGNITLNFSTLEN